MASKRRSLQNRICNLVATLLFRSVTSAYEVARELAILMLKFKTSNNPWLVGANSLVHRIEAGSSLLAGFDRGRKLVEQNQPGIFKVDKASFCDGS